MTIGEIDAEIRAAIARRDVAREQLVGALIDIDQCDQWIEQLLKRRTEAGTS